MSSDSGLRKYQKPHTNYGDQLTLLQSRGLVVTDQRVAMRALRSIGYYRFSAYTYPFRLPGQPIEPVADAKKVKTPRPARSDQFEPGTQFEDALALYRFDHDLRRVLFEGLQQIEVGLRVQIGHELGKTDPFGHLNRESLDPAACSQTKTWGSKEADGDAHDDWLDNFERMLRDAKTEDFVQHFNEKYAGDMPVWVATECMTFGSLTYLYALLPSRHAKRIAENLDIKDPKLAHGYLKALNVLRNHCAHNSRVWNRTTTYPPIRPPEKLTNERIHHLRECNNNRIYTLAALCAHIVIQLNPETNWPRTLKTQARKFPAPNGITLENTMGFPAGWDRLDIWNYDPKKS